MSAGRYRIQSFSRLTGVPPATLRAWERRYGVPAPERTGSGYRLYRDLDLFLVRRMVELVQDGHSAASAAKTASDALERESRPEPAEAASEAIIRALGAGDPIRVEHELRRAVFLSSTALVLERIIYPVLEHDEVSAAQKRVLRALTGAFVTEQIRMAQGSEGPLGLRCTGVHDVDGLAADALALRLVGWGYRTFSIGAGTTPAELKAAVRAFGPAFVVIGLDVLPAGESAQSTLLDGYAAAVSDLPWAVSGVAAACLGEAIAERRGLVGEADLGFKRRLERVLWVRTHRDGPDR